MCLPCASHKQSVKCVYAVPYWTNLTLHMKISSSRGTGSSAEAAELESGERRVWIQPFFAMLGVLSLPIRHFSTSCMGSEPPLQALVWLYWRPISHRQCPSLTRRPCGREFRTLCTQMGIYKTYHKPWLSTLSLHWSAGIRSSKEPC